LLIQAMAIPFHLILVTFVYMDHTMMLRILIVSL
jgi:hypothetical protein